MSTKTRFLPYHCLLARNIRLRGQQERLYRSEAREDYYIFMTAPVDFGEAAEKHCRFSNLSAADLITQSRAFGREPNALPTGVIAMHIAP